MLKMEIEYDQGILLVRLKGILNRKNSYKINNYVNPVIKKHNIKYLIYNFSNLKDIDTAGVDALINSKCYIKSNKGKIRVCESNDKVKEICKKIRIPNIKREIEARKLVEMI